MNSVPRLLGVLSLMMFMQSGEALSADVKKVSFSCKSGETCSGSFPPINFCDQCEIRALSCTWDTKAVDRIDFTVVSRIDDNARFVFPRVLSSDERKARGMADGVLNYRFQADLERFKVTFLLVTSEPLSATCYLAYSQTAKTAE